MAITFDVAQGVKATSSASATWSHTVTTQSNRILIIGVSSTATPTGVTYNSVALTQLSTSLSYNSSADVMSFWYLLAPSTGANSAVITMSASKSFIAGVSLSYYGVAQSGTFGTLATNTGSASPSSVTAVTTSSTQTVVDFVDNANGNTATANASQNKRFEPSTSGLTGGDIAATGSSMTLGWTFTSVAWGEMAVALNPFVASVLTHVSCDGMSGVFR